MELSNLELKDVYDALHSMEKGLESDLKHSKRYKTIEDPADIEQDLIRITDLKYRIRLKLSYEI